MAQYVKNFKGMTMQKKQIKQYIKELLDCMKDEAACYSCQHLEKEEGHLFCMRHKEFALDAFDCLDFENQTYCLWYVRK